MPRYRSKADVSSVPRSTGRVSGGGRRSGGPPNRETKPRIGKQRCPEPVPCVRLLTGQNTTFPSGRATATDAGTEAVRIGYEINFNRHCYKPQPMRSLEKIRADILALERETEGLLNAMYDPYNCETKEEFERRIFPEIEDHEDVVDDEAQDD